MNYLWIALRLAWKNYKWSILLSFCFSFAVGILWGANIGAVYPFAQVIFKGQNLHQWSAQELETAQIAIEKSEKQIAELSLKGEDSQSEIDIENQMISSWRSRIATVESTQPYIDAYAPKSPFITLLYLVAFLAIGTALKCLCLAMSMTLVSRVAFGLTRSLQLQFFDKVLDSKLGQVQSKDTGDTTARLGGDVGAVGGAVQILLGKSIREPIKMFTCLIGAAYINWRLLILSLLVCPIAAFLLILLAKSIKRTSLRVMEVNGSLIGFVIQVMQGYHVVKAFGNEELEKKRFEEKTYQVYCQQMKLVTYGALVRSNNEMLGIGMVCLSLVAGGFLVLNQETHIFGVRLAEKPMDFAGIMTFYALLIASADPIRKLGDVYGTIQAGIAGAERVFPLLEEEPTIKDPDNPVSLPSGDIVFNDVTFRYNANVPVLEGTQLTIRQGERIAIVGPNGCGKSTLVNLLLRFYDPASGSVTMGGVDLRDAKQEDLRSRIGLVTQNTLLFNDSILENIRYGKIDATDAEVFEAGEMAKVDAFVHSQTPHGYYSYCGESGNSLSGGQRQRVAIARAILRKPEIFIFDEATSQIDLESERLIHAAFDKCVGDKTAILVTHRPAALELVDRIVVMNEGIVEAIGTHQELLESSTTYYELYREETVKDRNTDQRAA